MTSHPPRRALALLTAAAVLATMTAATVASPAAAAKPKCQGFTATIVGTNNADRIVGTAKRDIIVAKGGNDRIFAKGGNDVVCAGPGNDVVHGGPGADRLWGQLGHDTLNGNAGNDFLAGQVGNDRLNGGINYDTCFQGTGTGTVVNCERPAPPAAPPPPAPTLVVAYTDVNRNHDYDAGDVMISEIVDTNRDGVVSPGDTINMGLYPKAPWVVAPARLRQTMEPWGVKSHPVTTGDTDPANPNRTMVQSGANVIFNWFQIGGNNVADGFSEGIKGVAAYSAVADHKNAGVGFDTVEYDVDSPSKPMETWVYVGDSTGDDHFIDVEIYSP